MRLLLALAMVVVGGGTAIAQPVRFVTDEAMAALAILDELAARRTPTEEFWRRLTDSEGYRRLRARESAMGRALTDSAMRAYLIDPATVARAGALRVTLARWEAADLTAAMARAKAYLPAGAEVTAKVYLLIKPATNSFVFEAATDPAIMLYLDPAVSPAKLANTVAHELHHIGYARACRGRSSPSTATPADQVRAWMGAFGEGLAMLAASGGPEVHPHAVSDSAERAQWDRDIAQVATGFRELDGFFADVLDGRLVAADSIRTRAMSFFGIQGPWYTVGWTMARAIETSRGRAGLLEVICHPAALVRRYDEVARERGDLPRWDRRLIERLNQPGLP